MVCKTLPRCGMFCAEDAHAGVFTLVPSHTLKRFNAELLRLRVVLPGATCCNRQA